MTRKEFDKLLIEEGYWNQEARDAIWAGRPSIIVPDRLRSALRKMKPMIEDFCLAHGVTLGRPQ